MWQLKTGLFGSVSQVVQSVQKCMMLTGDNDDDDDSVCGLFFSFQLVDMTVKKMLLAAWNS